MDSGNKNQVMENTLYHSAINQSSLFYQAASQHTQSADVLIPKHSLKHSNFGIGFTLCDSELPPVSSRVTSAFLGDKPDSFHMNLDQA